MKIVFIVACVFLVGILALLVLGVVKDDSEMKIEEPEQKDVKTEATPKEKGPARDPKTGRFIKRVDSQ